MSNKDVCLSVSKAILNGEWAKLDTILSDDFRYTGDGFEFSKAEYITFMKSLGSAMRRPLRIENGLKAL